MAHGKMGGVLLLAVNTQGSLAQSVRAAVSYTVGWGFDSLTTHIRFKFHFDSGKSYANERKKY